MTNRATFARSESNDPHSTTELWNQQAERWIAWAKDDSYFYEYNWPSFARILPDELGACLDLGCGEGRTTEALDVLASQVIGLEPSMTLATATKHRSLSVVRGVGDALPFVSQSFDTVVAFMVLHDLEQMATTCEEVSRVLRPHGVFCFAIIHPLSSARELFESRVDRSYWDVWRYTDHAVRGDLTMDFHSVHRPLEDYFAALNEAGMIVERLSEVRPDPSYVARNPDARDIGRLPIYMHVRARVIDSQREASNTRPH